MTKAKKQLYAQERKTSSLSNKNKAWVDDSRVNRVLAMVRDALADMPGVVGIALGGSWAHGTADDNSDVDIGMFYDITSPDQFVDIYNAIARLDDRSKSDAHSASEWGPWNSPGHWLIAGMNIDILPRDINLVKRAINRCAEGEVEIVHEAGRLRGISTAVFAGEVRYNIDIYDPTGALAKLRELTDPYPENLATALIKKFGKESEISLGAALPPARRGDFVYAYGYIYRAAASLNEVLFAAERRYLIHEKNAAQIASTFSVAPPDYSERIARAFSLLTIQPQGMLAALEELRILREDVMRLVSAMESE